MQGSLNIKKTTIFIDGNELEKCSKYWASNSGLYTTASEDFGHVEVTTLRQEADPKLADTTVRSFYFKGQLIASRFFMTSEPLMW